MNFDNASAMLDQYICIFISNYCPVTFPFVYTLSLEKYIISSRDKLFVTPSVRSQGLSSVRSQGLSEYI